MKKTLMILPAFGSGWIFAITLALPGDWLDLTFGLIAGFQALSFAIICLPNVAVRDAEERP